MGEVKGGYDARAEAADTVEAGAAPFESGPRESGAELYHQAEGRESPHLERDLGHSALLGNEVTPDDSHEETSNFETEAGETPEAEMHDIWDRRNETSGTIDLRNWGR